MGTGGLGGGQPGHEASPGVGPGAGGGMRCERRGWGDHSRSLLVGERRPSGLRGTWVPFACGSFGVAVELLLEGNGVVGGEKLLLEPVPWGGGTGVLL